MTETHPPSDANEAPFYIMAVCPRCNGSAIQRTRRGTRLVCENIIACGFSVPYDQVVSSLSARIVELESHLAQSTGSHSRSRRRWSADSHPYLKPVRQGARQPGGSE